MYISGMTVGPVSTNCYLVGDEQTKHAALIDPGDAGAELVRRATGAGYEIKAILLTHGHFDHIGGVKGVLNALAAKDETAAPIPVYINKIDYPAAPCGFDAHITLDGVENVQFYTEGDVVTLDGLVFHVISTPGHTPGGVTLQLEDCLFTGDTLFCGSCGRTDFPGSSMRDMMSSLRKLYNLPGDYRVYPGHESTTLMRHERAANPYLRQAALSHD